MRSLSHLIPAAAKEKKTSRSLPRWKTIPCHLLHSIKNVILFDFLAGLMDLEIDSDTSEGHSGNIGQNPQCNVTQPVGSFEPGQEMLV